MEQQYNPLAAIINVTDECNCRCTYCFTDPHPKHMKLDTGIDAIQWMVSNYYQRPPEERSDIHINFFGGEPMLRYKELILPLMEWADRNVHLENNHKIRWGMTTNGTLLTKEVLRYLSVRKDFDILFSCDGAEYTQNLQRPLASGEGSFDLVNKNIPDLLYYFPNVTFRSTVTPATVHLLSENYIFAKMCGFRNYFFMPNCREEWSIEAIQELGYQISNISWIMYNDIVNKRQFLSYNDLFKFIVEYVLDDNQEKRKVSCHQCGFGCDSVGITCNGQITACQEKNTIDCNNLFYIGDIYKGIDDSLRNKLLSFISKNHETRTNEQLNCEECDFNKYCATRICPSTNYDLTGDPCKSNLITCYWQIILYQVASAIMETAALENNQEFADFIKQSAQYMKEEC